MESRDVLGGLTGARSKTFIPYDGRGTQYDSDRTKDVGTSTVTGSSIYVGQKFDSGGRFRVSKLGSGPNKRTEERVNLDKGGLPKDKFLRQVVVPT